MDLLRYHNINFYHTFASSNDVLSSITNLIIYGGLNLLAIIVIVITFDIFVLQCFHHLKVLLKFWHGPLKLARMRAGQDNLVAVERPEGLPYKTINTRRGNAMRWIVIDHIREKPVRTKKALLYILSRQKRKAMENITAQSLYHKIDAYEPVERFYPLHIKPMDIMFYIPERKLEQMEFVVNKLRKPSLDSIVSDVTWEGSSEEEDESDEDYIVDLKTDKIQMNLDRCETFVNEIEQYYFKKDRRPGFSPYSRSESRARSPYTSIYERDAFLLPTSKLGIGVDIEIVEKEKRVHLKKTKRKFKIFSDPLLHIAGDARKVQSKKETNLIDPISSSDFFGIAPQRSLSDQSLNWKRKIDITCSFDKRSRKDISRTTIIFNDPYKPDKSTQPEGSGLSKARNQNRRSSKQSDSEDIKIKKKISSNQKISLTENSKSKKNIFSRLFSSAKTNKTTSKSKINLSVSSKEIHSKSSKSSLHKIQSKLSFSMTSKKSKSSTKPEINNQSSSAIRPTVSNALSCGCTCIEQRNCVCHNKNNRALYLAEKMKSHDDSISSILSKLKKLRRISEQVASSRQFDKKAIEKTDIRKLAASLEHRLNEYQRSCETYTVNPVKEIIPAISTLSKTLISIDSSTEKKEEEKIMNKINMQLFYLNTHLKDVLHEIVPVHKSSHHISSSD